MLSEEDEAAPQSDHSVELTTDTESASLRRRRRIARFVVAACGLGATCILALAFMAYQRAADEERALEGARSASVQDGWKTLAMVAAEGARQRDAQNAAAAQPVAAPAAPEPAPATTNVVIVNVPQATASTSTVSAPPLQPTSAAPPAPGVSNRTTVVYVPTPVLPSDIPNGNVPGQNVNSGSTVGSLPNPALPNGSSTSASPSPDVPNGSVNVPPPTPTQPVGGVPLSPPTTGITP
jgi:hypothetical protein